MDFEELKFWFEVVQRTAIPTDGDLLTSDEKTALARSCRMLALIAQNVADKVVERL